ncbi:MAG: glycoside hydrolase family 2 TIM barrel-domain containing protein [Candidatus Omnitrophica bacterium]|nr:glycoside hydrolase family 2 TIM barrel-domain containing protein [Candidatus Omnitrophota bacterium]
MAGVLCAGIAVFLLFLWMSVQPRPAVYIRKLKNNRYKLMTGNRPYVVKGVCYNPIPVGSSHDYDWWSDPYKPWLVDGKLMKDMGINTVRIYQSGENPEQVKKVLKDLFNLFGIRVVMGNWLGFWEYPCPFYGDKDFQQRVKSEVLEMVKTYKDEPGILLWILGNENNYSCQGNINPWSTDEIDAEPDLQKQRFMRFQIYYSFINEVAQEIHKIDPNHPVALGNGELIGLDVANQYCRDVDLVACVIYRGKTFGNMFRSLRATFDKPLLISEFGADSFNAELLKEDQNMQAFFLEAQWRQIYENLSDNPGEEGNCIGGIIFEWTDEWWKHNSYDPESWKIHDTESNWSNGSYYFDIKANGNKNMNEEWFGIVAVNPAEKEGGLDKRIPRKAYYVLREFWKNPAAYLKKNSNNSRKKESAN